MAHSNDHLWNFILWNFHVCIGITLAFIVNMRANEHVSSDTSDTHTCDVRTHYSVHCTVYQWPLAIFPFRGIDLLLFTISVDGVEYFVVFFFFYIPSPVIYSLDACCWRFRVQQTVTSCRINALCCWRIFHANTYENEIRSWEMNKFRRIHSPNKLRFMSNENDTERVTFVCHHRKAFSRRHSTCSYSQTQIRVFSD